MYGPWLLGADLEKKKTKINEHIKDKNTRNILYRSVTRSF